MQDKDQQETEYLQQAYRRHYRSRYSWASRHDRTCSHLFAIPSSAYNGLKTDSVTTFLFLS